MNTLTDRLILIPVKRIGDEAYERLRHAIIAGRFRPGERVLELNLAKQMGISRTPIREAVRMLEQDGLVEVTPHRGTVIRKLTEEEAFNIYEVRAVLEGLAAKLAVERGSRDDIDKLRELFEAAKRAWKRRQKSAVIECNNRFHDTLAQMSGNRVLAKALGDLRASVNLLRIMSWSVAPKQPARTISEHGKIVRAIAAGNATRAQRYAMEHIWSSWRTIKAYLKNSQIEQKVSVNTEI